MGFLSFLHVKYICLWSSIDLHWSTLICIELYWVKLIFIDRNWSAMSFIEPHFRSIPENWFLLIGIDRHWGLIQHVLLYSVLWLKHFDYISDLTIMIAGGRDVNGECVCCMFWLLVWCFGAHVVSLLRLQYTYYNITTPLADCKSLSWGPRVRKTRLSACPRQVKMVEDK